MTANSLKYPFKTTTVNITSNKSTVSNMQSKEGEKLQGAVNIFNDPNNIGSRSKSSKRQRIDPQITPKCFQCERFGHRTTECSYHPFCSSCKDYYPRGTLPQCANSTWNFRSPGSLKRINIFLPIGETLKGLADHLGLTNRQTLSKEEIIVLLVTITIITITTSRTLTSKYSLKILTATSHSITIHNLEILLHNVLHIHKISDLLIGKNLTLRQQVYFIRTISLQKLICIFSCLKLETILIMELVSCLQDLIPIVLNHLILTVIIFLLNIIFSKGGGE